MTLHNLFNLHAADLLGSRWKHGRFITDCTICGREMVKPPSETWRLSTPLELAEVRLEHK